MTIAKWVTKLRVAVAGMAARAPERRERNIVRLDAKEAQDLIRVLNRAQDALMRLAANENESVSRVAREALKE